MKNLANKQLKHVSFHHFTDFDVKELEHVRINEFNDDGFDSRIHLSVREAKALRDFLNRRFPN